MKTILFDSWRVSD